MSIQTTTTTADSTDVPRSIARVFDLLEIVLTTRGCNLTAAANAAGLTPTTALRYLRALEARGYVDRDRAGDFSAGPTILRIAASLRGGTALDRLAALAQPHLDDLARETGESTYLAVSDGKTGTYIATAESPRAIRHVGWIGQDVSLEGSALGAALAEPGTTTVRTGAVEADTTAISRALPDTRKFGVAVSIVGPEHRFGVTERNRHEQAITITTNALINELRTAGEDYSS